MTCTTLRPTGGSSLRVLAVALALVALAACSGGGGTTPDEGPRGSPPPTPTGLAASDGASSAHVAVTWNGVAEATSYTLRLQDGTVIASGLVSPSYLDTTAPGGLPTSSGLNLAATDGTDTGGVKLTWSTPAVGSGATRQYQAVAVNAFGASAPSASDAGFRAGSPVTGYEVSIDGGAFVDAGLVTSLLDADAPAATVTPGTAMAADGAEVAQVALSVAGASAAAGATRSYQVRAVNAAGPGPALSVQGRRGVGALSYQWQRSAAASDAGYSDLAGVSGATANDDGAPADGAQRWYRCRVSAAGAADAFTPGDPGFRAVLPAVGTLAATDVTQGSLVARGSLADLGVPTATDHGLCVGLVDPAVAASTCVGLGAPVLTGDFQTPFSSLDAGTAHHVRAYADHAVLGRVWGDEVTVATLPLEPANLVASDGTSAAGVSLSWTGAAGATAYRIRRNGILLTDAPDTTWTDTTAPGGIPGAPPGFAATDGFYSAYVQLYWDFPTVPAGPVQTYSVTALNGSGESGAVTDDGNRGVETATYEVSLDDAQTWTSTGTTRQYVDWAAPVPTIVPGAAVAADGLSMASIALSLTGDAYPPGTTASYLVRARTSGGAGPTSADTGYRSPKSIRYQWEVSAGDDPSNWTTVSGATTATAAHLSILGAPTSGEGRYFRCQVAADGVPPVASAPDRGYLLPSPLLSPRADLWVTDGAVSALARSGNTLYLGGNFATVGPPTGAWGVADATTAQVDTTLPAVNGHVYATLPDGSGGWYLAGAFTRVGGLPRSRLAHVTDTGIVDPSFDPSVGGTVLSLAIAGSTLYVGGEFPNIGGQNRANLAAIDKTTGAVAAWNPSPSSAVVALATDGTTLYAGGDFFIIGGTGRSYLAAFTIATGAIDSSFAPSPSGGVRALALGSGVLYAGGIFSSIGGQSRSRVAAVQTAGGAATAWNPNPSPAAGGITTVTALALSGSTVYVGGIFANIGGAARNNLAAIDATTGLATAWNPNSDNRIDAMVVDGATVYVAGWFSNIGGQARTQAAALDATTGLATAWNPNATYRCRALAVAGGKVSVGGEFATIGGVKRARLAAIDLATGQPTAWNPGASSDVYALTVSGSLLYVGGMFTTIGGQARNRLAALDLASGTPSGWNPNVNSLVRKIVVSGSNVYVAGSFTAVGASTRNYLAAIDATSGLATAWDPAPNFEVKTIALSGTTLAAGGLFTYIAGTARNYLAFFDTTNGALTSLQPTGVTSPAQVDYATSLGSQVFFRMYNSNYAIDVGTGTTKQYTYMYPYPNVLSAAAGHLLGGGGDLGTGMARFAAVDIASGDKVAWSPQMTGYISAILWDGTAVYVGGSNITMVDGERRTGLAAFDVP